MVMFMCVVGKMHALQVDFFSHPFDGCFEYHVYLTTCTGMGINACFLCFAAVVLRSPQGTMHMCQNLKLNLLSFAKNW